jgi:hypothetical protein
MKKLLIVLGSLLLLTQAVSAKTAAKVNGITITVEEANNALKALTEGKMTWGKLPDAGKKELIHMMAPSKLALVQSKKELSQNEQDAVISGYWMKQKISKIDVSDREAKETYEKMVKIAKKSDSSQKIPSFSQVKENIKLQMKKDQVVNNLMKNAKIKIY